MKNFRDIYGTNVKLGEVVSIHKDYTNTEYQTFKVMEIERRGKSGVWVKLKNDVDGIKHMRSTHLISEM